MIKFYLARGGLACLICIGLVACEASVDGAKSAPHANNHLETESSASNKFGHLSAIYLCGDDQLQTSYTDQETKISYKGDKFDAERSVRILDTAFAGEIFTANHKGDLIVFQGKGYDAKLTVNDDVIICEKLSCVPLGETH